jgi:AAHS family 4-hydroxybenzoate transporter-like MFS transporter
VVDESVVAFGDGGIARLFGAGPSGLTIGAFGFGPLADRLGRPAILALTVLFFGTAVLASAFAPSIGMLILLRFVTGLGRGGAMPNAITLTSEDTVENEIRRSEYAALCSPGGNALRPCFLEQGVTAD